jgi:hypothetical protein
MNVVAISTPRLAGWRWRIVDYSGQMVEESYGTFPSIETAVADGTQRLHARDDRDIASMPSRTPTRAYHHPRNH